MNIIKFNNTRYHLISYRNIKPNKYYINENGTSIISVSNTNIKELAIQFDNCGYKKVMLQDIYGKSIKVFIHQLIMSVFGHPCPNEIIDPTIDHINMNKNDNRITNLRWLERSDNSRFGNLNSFGERNGNCKISEQTAKEIIKLLLDGYTENYICTKLNVSPDTVSNIKFKKSWVKLTEDVQFSIKNKHDPLTDDVKIKIANYLISGKYTENDIAKKCNVTLDMVRNVKFKRGKNDDTLLKDFNFETKDYNLLNDDIKKQIKFSIKFDNYKCKQLVETYDISKSSADNYSHWCKINTIPIYYWLFSHTQFYIPINSCSYTPYNCDNTKEFQDPIGEGISPFDRI